MNTSEAIDALTAAITHLTTLRDSLQAGDSPNWHLNPIAANSLMMRTNDVPMTAITIHVDPSQSPPFPRFISVQNSPYCGQIQER